MLFVLAGQTALDGKQLLLLRRRQKRGEQVEWTERERRMERLFPVEAHLAFSFLSMLFALLLMYKLAEGSKHLLTFLAAGVFVVPMLETRFFKKAAVIGVTFAYLYSYKALDPYDYQVPFEREERCAQLENWQSVFGERLVLNTEETPCFDNVVIWVFSDETQSGSVNTAWQILYALPEGFGISCCMPDYVKENLTDMESRFILTVAGGEVDRLCAEAGYEELGRDSEVVCYCRY